MIDSRYVRRVAVGDRMSRDLLDQRANQTLHRFMMTGRDLGLVAGYHAFQRAAELEDRCERLKAAAWLVLGRVIIVALCSPSIALQKNDYSDMSPFKIIGQDISKGLSRDASALALASEIRQQARHITNELG